MATKKSSPKKSATKKPAAKKTTRKKASKSAAKKSTIKKASPAKATLKAVNERCKCKQKKNGKFYCFMLQSGRWVQASGVPYDTQEDCEADCCEE